MTPFDKLIKVKIVQPGMQSYTGYIRGHRFVDGASFEAIPVRAALLLGASCLVEDDAGQPLNPNTYVFKDADEVSADDVAVASVPKEEVVEPAVEEEDEVVEFYEPDQEFDDAKMWTREELEQIADQDGIQGLRDIGSEYNVKERSINGLVDAIMKAQVGATKLAGEE